MASFKYFRSSDFQRKGQELEDSVKDAKSQGFEANDELAELIELDAHRRKVHQDIQRVTGRDFHVITDSSDKRIAGLAKINTGESFIREASLDDREEALHIAVHEAIHHEAMNVVDLRAHIGKRATDILEAALAEETSYSKISDIDLVEGFVEDAAAKETGEWSDCAYNRKEVPAARALDRLARKYGVKTLKQDFRHKREAAFYRGLSQLVTEIQKQNAA